VAQRVGRGIALLFHDRGTRRGWVVSSTPRPHFTPGKGQVLIIQEAGWAPGPVWTGGKSRPYRDSIPGCEARSQSLYRLSYRAHIHVVVRKMIDNLFLIPRTNCRLNHHISLHLQHAHLRTIWQPQQVKILYYKHKTVLKLSRQYLLV